ncbi:hypothetical protein NDU88_003186 [Pleurodeles waltl]|uniref:Uncharacterized protein n=1 Tax=Pleurodeles waltl TaxID=8319 RepID=A0AAV7M2Q5_PLEWA|nr:hypothetical protein NDU88_003186 [Pleurodeles waltl]
MEARCTALAVRLAIQKSRQKPEIPLAVQVRALVRKENWDPYTWDGAVSDNDDWDCEGEVEVRVAELGEVESEKESVVEAVNGGQIQNSRLVRDNTQSELLEINRMFRQMPAEPLFKSLVRLWGTGADGKFLSPTELLKTTHAMLGTKVARCTGATSFFSDGLADGRSNCIQLL